jgi:hypothetical protein
MNSPFRIVGFRLGVRVFRFEFGGHGRRENTGFEVLGGDYSNNLDGEVVAYVNDSAGKDMVLGF